MSPTACWCLRMQRCRGKKSSCTTTPALSRNIYIQTAAHVISNHQSNVRFGSKLRFMLGVASLIARFTGARDIPAVRDTLGRLAAMEAGYNAMIDGPIE